MTARGMVQKGRSETTPANRCRVHQNNQGDLLALGKKLSSHLEGNDSHSAVSKQEVWPFLLDITHLLDPRRSELLD